MCNYFSLCVMIMLACLGCNPNNQTIGKNQAALGFSWDLVIDPADSETECDKVNRLETSTGQVFSDDPDTENLPTLDGLVVDGLAPLTFDADARLHSEDALVSGAVTGFTVEIVHKPADAWGSLDRGYLLYFENDTNTSSSHHVISQHANLSGVYKQKGIALGGTWSASPAEVQVYTGLQVETWVVRPSGVVTYYRDGHEVDYLTWSPTSLYLDDMWLGAGYGEPLGAAYRGAIYSLRGVGRPLTRREVLDSQQEQIDRFEIPGDREWQPSDEASFTGWFDEHDMRLDTSGEDKLQYWVNHSNYLALSNGNNTATRPTRTRLGGMWGISCDGADDYLGGYGISDYLGAAYSSSYEYAIEMVLHSANSSTGAAYDLEQVLGDVGGFLWLAFRQKSGGGYEAVIGHYGGSSVGMVSVVHDVSLEEELTIHVWYSDGYLHATVNDSAATPVAAANSFSNGTYGLRVCGRNANTALQADVQRLVTFNGALSSSSRTEFDTWLNRIDN